MAAEKLMGVSPLVLDRERAIQEIPFARGFNDALVLRLYWFN